MLFLSTQNVQEIESFKYFENNRYISWRKLKETMLYIDALAMPPVARMIFWLERLATFPAGLNFINVLRSAFTRVDPESIKRYWWLNCVFTLSGSASLKGAGKTLVKFPAVVQFHQRFTCTSSIWAQRSQRTERHWWLNCLYASTKAARKMLVKLTKGVQFHQHFTSTLFIHT